MSAENVFDNLESIRLSPDAAATAGTREVLRHVPVRKPNRTEFVRVHPDADMQIATGVFMEVGDEPARLERQPVEYTEGGIDLRHQPALDAIPAPDHAAVHVRVDWHAGPLHPGD